MTKVRAPLTWDNALSKIAGVLGWEAMAEITDRKERTVRNWGDPDTGESCPIDCAHALDLAYQAKGGDGAPMFETYALLLEQARAERFSDQVELARRTIRAIEEDSQAHQALIAATLPGATAADRARASREVEEALAALKRTLPLLTEGTGPNGGTGEGTPRGGVS